MGNSVRQLRSFAGSYERGLEAFRAARFHDAVASLHGIDSIAASTLLARAHLRLEDPHAALRAATREAESDRDRGELALLRAAAASRLGDDAVAGEAFRDARAYGVSSGDPALESEVEFYFGLDAFRKNDIDEARMCCGRGLAIARLAVPYEGPTGDIPLAHVAARHHEVLGLTEVARGQYRKQVRHARASLETLDECSVPDVFQAAFALRNLAILARDFDLDGDTSMIASRVDAIAWTDDIAALRFTINEEIGWSTALRGNFSDAFRRFRIAEGAASTDAERILVAVDRAVLGKDLGYRAMIGAELDYALEVSRRVDWETVAGDNRLVLVLLAQALAPVSAHRARETFERYAAICKAMEPRYVARLEARIRAEEAYTLGIILRAEGRDRASVERLHFAFDAWESIGYEWRAARAALELAELDGGEVFKLAVARELRQRPASPFSARARIVA